MNLVARARALWEAALRWYQSHSQRDQRIVLGVIVAAGLSLVYVAVVEPVLDYRKAVAQEIVDGQEELEHSMRFLAAKDTLRAEREELRKRLTQAKTRLLPGGTGTLGAAALQERANALATEKGITVQSTQVMKEEALDPYRKVSIRMTLSGELKPLAELISGLEYGQQLGIPFLEVSRRGAVAGAKGPRTISATLEVSGFVHGGGGKGDGAKGGDATSDADATAPGADAANDQPGADGQAPASTTTLASEPTTSTTLAPPTTTTTRPLPTTSTTLPHVVPPPIPTTLPLPVTTSTTIVVPIPVPTPPSTEVEVLPPPAAELGGGAGVVQEVPDGHPQGEMPAPDEGDGDDGQ
ncbi:MAG TPA: type II secretion system protein GspM [Candidatus Eisenbacteria bacterium]|nr:type II secretion system protein GspM [Candidatus Eisenbacteria bacterium]